MSEFEHTREYRPSRRLPAPRFHPRQQIPKEIPEGYKLGKFDGIPMIVPLQGEESALVRQQVLYQELNNEVDRARRVCEVTEGRKVF